jgi:16S rRNA (guanine966-N2)-methyltransferase
LIKDHDKFEGKEVVDLFAGTGSIAFEALSRGASNATLVDIEMKYLNCAMGFASKIGESNKMTFVRSDVTNLPNSHRKYDIAFIDPPYFQSLIFKSLHSLHQQSWLKPSALVALELARKEDLQLSEHYQIIDQRIYGNTKLIILRYINIH